MRFLLPRMSLLVVVVSGMLGMILQGATELHAANVEDGAGFFSKESLEKANAEIADFAKQYVADLRIKTFEQIAQEDIERVKEMDRHERDDYFTELIKQDAKALPGNGILILIWKEPPRFQVTEGAAIQKRGFGTRDRNQLRDTMRSGFMKKEYDQALLDGIHFLRLRAKTMPVAPAGMETPAVPTQVDPLKTAPWPGPSGAYDLREIPLIGWIGIIVLLMISVWTVSAVTRARSVRSAGSGMSGAEGRSGRGTVTDGSSGLAGGPDFGRAHDGEG